MKGHPETSTSRNEAQETSEQEEGLLYNRIVQICLILATAGLVLLGIGIASFFWIKEGHKDVKSELLPTQPDASASAPLALLSGASEPVASSAPLASVSEPLASASSPTVLATPRRLSREEVASLLPLLQAGPQPSDCESAIHALVVERNVVVRQAQMIAKMAYPELCAPDEAPAKPIAEPSTTEQADKLEPALRPEREIGE